MIFFQPKNVFGLTCHNCYPGCDMVLDNRCKCGAGKYSTCESEYKQVLAGQCHNNNHINSNNCEMCPDGTGTASNAPNAYRAFCITCYAGTYSDGGECKKCKPGYQCPATGIVEPMNFFTCEDFFFGAHALGVDPYYKVWANPRDHCGASLVTDSNAGFACTAGELGTVSHEYHTNPGEEDDQVQTQTDTTQYGGWVKDSQGNSFSNEVKKPLWYCQYDPNRFGPGQKALTNGLKCRSGQYPVPAVEEGYSAKTISGIERGATTCANCPKGYYSRFPPNCGGEGQPECIVTQCEPCPVGTYQKNSGQSVCKSCPQRTYQDEEGQTNCKVCPDPWMTTDGEGKTSVNDCNVQIEKMHFTTTEADACSWEWPSAVTDGPFMQFMNVSLPKTVAPD